MTTAKACPDPAGGDSNPFSKARLAALQKTLGNSWLVGTGTYPEPEGRMITAQPWPSLLTGKIVRGHTADDVLAEVRRREASHGS